MECSSQRMLFIVKHTSFGVNCNFYSFVQLLALNRVLDEGNSDRPLHVVVEMRDMANALQEAQPSVSESALKTITEWHR